ncbi:putative oligopeptide transporter [Cyphellophora attinorum]|uniref:Putative oligopeptide transporter n=1 Tax=Cyphellophora attinorum TaxID=1664694 RepID=A0A0N1H946_9EURO|nr:putative oligopeptide transporter [Phialophora attinorum]KPI43826.1 putative oligopeptide transporter [Phialophora attinorum]
MAPDRGTTPHSQTSTPRESSDLSEDHELSDTSSPGGQGPAVGDADDDLSRTRSDHACYGSTVDADSPLDGTNFTLRGLLVGTGIGIIICFSNTYFGLQTGWVSGMAMPASLMGFAVFKSISRILTLPFTPVENVLVQTVAGAVGTMPLGIGFVGVIPSLQFLLKEDEGAPLDFSLWRLIVWGIGLCLFGVAFGMPLRKQVIIRERLKFPSGTATALMISVLHGGTSQGDKQSDGIRTQGTEEREQLLNENEHEDTNEGNERDQRADWKAQIKMLLQACAGSGLYTLIQYFIPILHKLPIFGMYLAKTWVWTLNPSPAYVGQGIIMGPATTLHMLLGAIVGWAVLSPVAKSNGWAPGDVNDWETGSRGWIVWVSLAIMLADAVVNLGWLLLRPAIHYGPELVRVVRQQYQQNRPWADLLKKPNKYLALDGADDHGKSSSTDPPDDAPPHHLVPNSTIAWFLPLTMIICVVCVHITFGEYISIPLNILSLLLSLVLAIMGVRALGETDLNPVSGISKLTQLIFAAIAPSRNAVIINLIAGAVSEAGALQAGDILQDLKAGHLIGASPVHSSTDKSSAVLSAPSFLPPSTSSMYRSTLSQATFSQRRQHMSGSSQRVSSLEKVFHPWRGSLLSPSAPSSLPRRFCGSTSSSRRKRGTESYTPGYREA